MTTTRTNPTTVVTAEQIAKHYSASMDSVNLLNSPKPEMLSDEMWATMVSANKAHLKIMLAKTFWTTEDLQPLHDASQD